MRKLVRRQQPHTRFLVLQEVHTANRLSSKPKDVENNPEMDFFLKAEDYTTMLPDIYIYIYIQREREREREIHTESARDFLETHYDFEKF